MPVPAGLTPESVKKVGKNHATQSGIDWTGFPIKVESETGSTRSKKSQIG